MSQFLLDRSEYTRDMDIFKHSFEDTAFYMSRMSGKPEHICLAHIKQMVSKEGATPLKNPVTTVIAKDKNGDRYITTTGYMGYLKRISQEDLIAAPSMTTYVQPEKEEGLVGKYIEQNLDLRNQAKHELFIAEGLEDWVTANIKQNEQTSHKVFNNGISGAQSIGSTPLALMSAHSTLTSGCRAATSYANATIERFQIGLRHYWSADCVKTNITSIVRNSNYPAIKSVMAKYNLAYPTAAQVMDMIKTSSDQYWQNDIEMQRIKKYVGTLTEFERAAFLFTGDMYSMRLVNEGFVREFLTELITPTPDYEVKDPVGEAKKLKGDEQILATFLCAEKMAGKTIDYLAENDVQQLVEFVQAYHHINNTMKKYSDFIRAFFVTKNLPANISKTRDIRRGAVVGSDTDSSLFHSRRWVKWYYGEVLFDYHHQKIWHAMVYMTCQTVAHSLAMLSGGMGVKARDLYKLAMKNEYAFPIFALTPIAKHYFAAKSAREGALYKALKEEIKGVGFVDSNCPKEIIEECAGYIEKIFNDIYSTGHLYAMPILRSMAKTERSIIESVKRGESTYLKRVQVKPASEYKKPMSQNYFYHELWEKVFAPKYGPAPPPPYRGVRIAADIPNKTALKEWIEGFQDLEMRARLTEALGTRDKIESLILPLPVIEAIGIPEEILEAVNIRKLVYGTVSCFYLVAEAMGIRMINDKYTRLLSDML